MSENSPTVHGRLKTKAKKDHLHIPHFLRGESQDSKEGNALCHHKHF